MSQMDLEKIKSLKIKKLETNEKFEPSSVITDKENNIFISDRKENIILNLNSNGKLIKKIGKGIGKGFGKEDECFNLPWGISITEEGNLILSDRNNHKIKIFFSKEGNFYILFSSCGNGKNQFLSWRKFFNSINKKYFNFRLF